MVPTGAPPGPSSAPTARHVAEHGADTSMTLSATRSRPRVLARTVDRGDGGQRHSPCVGARPRTSDATAVLPSALHGGDHHRCERSLFGMRRARTNDSRRICRALLRQHVRVLPVDLLRGSPRLLHRRPVDVPRWRRLAVLHDRAGASLPLPKHDPSSAAGSALLPGIARRLSPRSARRSWSGAASGPAALLCSAADTRALSITSATSGTRAEKTRDQRSSS